MGRRCILGLGNYMQNDDGIGLRIVEQIMADNLDEGFEAVEIGSDGAQVLTYMGEDIERILLVDCASMGKNPGDFLVFGPEDVRTGKTTGNISTHEGDILKLVEMGKRLYDTLPEIRILAVEPESMDGDMRLSEVLEKNLEAYVSAAVEEINR